MINKFTHAPVFPIVPCYTERQLLDIDATIKYAQYLVDNGAEILMTTAGTTQFNLLSNSEIQIINKSLAAAFPDKTIIMGLRADSFLLTQSIIKVYNKLRFNDNTFLMLKYPERYYNDDIIERYFHILAEASDYPILIHCNPLMNGITGKTHDYTAKLINKICSNKNIVGVKEETSNLTQAYSVVKELNSDIGTIFAGGSQRRYTILSDLGYSGKTFLVGVGSVFPRVDIEYKMEFDNYGNKGVDNDIESKCFDVFFKYGWHPSLRYALQYSELIPEHNRQPWPSLDNYGAIQTVVDFIKGML